MFAINAGNGLKEDRLSVAGGTDTKITVHKAEHIESSVVAAGSSSASGQVHDLQLARVFEMTSEMYGDFSERTKNKNWAQTVPEVRMKGTYVNVEIPTAKGEGVGRTNWPVSLKKDRIELPEFQARLQKIKGKAAGSELTGAAYKTYLGASRVMGCLEIVSKPGQGIHNQLHMQSRVDLFYKCQIQ